MRLLRRALIALAFAATLPALADVYVVVPSSSSIRAMTQKEVQALYMGRTRAFPDGSFALPFDLPRDDAARAAFYRALTGMNPAEVNSYWARLMFSGQTMPPQPLPGEVAMVDVVRRNPSAIGYLPQPPSDPGLRVVLVLKETR